MAQVESTRSWWTLVGSLMLIAGVAAMCLFDPYGISRFYFFRQDIPVACLMLAGAMVFPYLGWSRGWQEEFAPTARTMAMVAALIVAAGMAGHWFIMLGYDLSRDQAMATFAAEQIARGTLVTPVPQEWQPFGRAMQPLYYHRSVSPNLAWVSQYLPVNSTLQALGGWVADRSIANPLILVAGLAALWKVARRIWPARKDVAVVVVVLGATSSQLLVNAMTSFAMVGHFSLNMAWLALFLRRDGPGMAGALVMAFLAMGLHQFHFHLMFVAPFLIWLLLRRQWFPALVYAAGYAVLLLFWAKIYPVWLIEQAGIPSAAPTGVNLERYVESRASRLWDFSALTWFFNLVRFIAWENVAMFPLLAVAFVAAWKSREARDGLFVSLFGSCAIGLIFLVYQGHGFGYRYLSGVIGCFCLLAGYGWVRLLPQPGPGRPWALLKAACCLTLIVTLPLQLTMARHMVAPYARLHAAIGKADADVVLIDTEGGFLAQDVVQNGPDFARRPKTMDLALVPADALERLCNNNRVMRIDQRHYRAVGMREGPTVPQVHDRLLEQRRALERLSCAQPMPLAT